MVYNTRTMFKKSISVLGLSLLLTLHSFADQSRETRIRQTLERFYSHPQEVLNEIPYKDSHQTLFSKNSVQSKNFVEIKDKARLKTIGKKNTLGLYAAIKNESIDSFLENRPIALKHAFARSDFLPNNPTLSMNITRFGLLITNSKQSWHSYIL